MPTITPPTPDAPAETTPPSPEQVAAIAAAADQLDDLKQRIIAKLKTCYDPEISVNIYELGLIYDLDVTPEGTVQIKMTLTSPACPVAGSLPPEVQSKVSKIPGVTSAKVDVVWDPPWSMERMSEAARLQLGFY
jgi:FeS assembly SUF system protein